jgi:hypothetical protein
MAYSVGLDDEEDEMKPDTSVASRPPVSPISMTPDPVVKQFLMQKNATSKSTTLMDDPLMKQYMKDQSDVDQFRQAQGQANTIANVGQALSQMSAGTATPQENGVYKSIAAQNQSMLGEKDKDLERRRKVMEAIEGRASREMIEQGRREDRDIQRNMLKASKDQARHDKREQEAKLSDKQTEGLQEFDDSLATMKSVLGQLGNHSNWTGMVDGRVPDTFVGPDQVNFRAELGRMVDKYRKLITGAGASNQELKRLEGRLPSVTDNFANFVAKANGFISEVERQRGSFLKNLNAKGKNTKPYESGITAAQESQGSKILVSNGKETLQIDPSDLAEAEKDGYKRM